MLRFAHPEMFSQLFSHLAMLEGDNGGGTGGAGAGTGTGAPPKKEGEGAKPEDEKLTLTKADLDAQLKKAREDAVAEAQRVADDAAKKAKEEADKKAALEKGEFEKLYKAEEQKRIQAEQNSSLALKQKDAEIELNRYLADKHSDYVKSATYIKPLLTIAHDTKPEEITAQIKKHADQFVADHPHTKSGAPGGAGNRGNINSGKNPPEKPENKTRSMQASSGAF